MGPALCPWGGESLWWKPPLYPRRQSCSLCGLLDGHFHSVRGNLSNGLIELCPSTINDMHFMFRQWKLVTRYTARCSIRLLLGSSSLSLPLTQSQANQGKLYQTLQWSKLYKIYIVNLAYWSLIRILMATWLEQCHRWKNKTELLPLN